MNEGYTMTMFWAGALMAFTPLVFASVLLGVWWYQRKRRRGAGETSDMVSPASHSQNQGQ